MFIKGNENEKRNIYHYKDGIDADIRCEDCEHNIYGVNEKYIWCKDHFRKTKKVNTCDNAKRKL